MHHSLIFKSKNSTNWPRAIDKLGPDIFTLIIREQQQPCFLEFCVIYFSFASLKGACDDGTDSSGVG